MKTNNVIQEKSFTFAVRVIRLYKHLLDRGVEVILLRQFLRCGTSIGANVEEAIGGQSKKDFVAKISISYKEAREVNYWLRLLKEVEILTKKEADSMLIDSEELLKILGSILRSAKRSKDDEYPNS